MPTILPISDLRNYTNVLNQVDVGKPVYLTRNGRGTYVISKIDDYDPEASDQELFQIVKEAEESIKAGDGITLEELAQKYNIVL